MATNESFDKVVGKILRHIGVGLGDEFDQNFERQAFFAKAWQRRKSPLRPGGHILVDTGKLRQSVHRRISGSSITFASDLPYAAIHNEGGDIKVTERMKRFFRHKFYEAQGGFGRGKQGGKRKLLSDGAFYAWTSRMSLSPEAEFWRAMAMMKVGKVIHIPRRQFIGMAPEVEQTVTDIIERNLSEYFDHLDLTKK